MESRVQPFRFAEKEHGQGNIANRFQVVTMNADTCFPPMKIYFPARENKFS
ncbi:hypothetical protein PARMER_00244 [Parabacteroides merdae ATCC 43184]|nr:hypothetical protein PARMER_00244 [Parabacteroides merdae ATCC 43184]